MLGAFAHFGARAMADAVHGTYASLGWTPVPDFEEPLSAIKRLMDEHQGTA